MKKEFFHGHPTTIFCYHINRNSATYPAQASHGSDINNIFQSKLETSQNDINCVFVCIHISVVFREYNWDLWWSKKKERKKEKGIGRHWQTFPLRFVIHRAKEIQYMTSTAENNKTKEELKYKIFYAHHHPPLVQFCTIHTDIIGKLKCHWEIGWFQMFDFDCLELRTENGEIYWRSRNCIHY